VRAVPAVCDGAEAAVTPDDVTAGDGDRVPAGILFGDMKGSTAEAEIDEPSSVAKLREYLGIVNDAAKRFGPNFYKVKSEGDGFMATFATAHCMVECGFAVQEEFRRRGWQVRLGGHYGEVYRNDAGDFVGADVNRAARIQAAADAQRGQFLVSDVVQAIVRNRLRMLRFEAHAPIVAKGVPDALVVFEVLPAVGAAPHATAPPHRAARRGWAIGAAAVLAVALVTGAVWYARGDGAARRSPSLPLAAPHDTASTIAVMEFENQRADDAKNDWYAKALQAAFNTELSKIPQLSVVAPEIIRRTARDAGLDRMAAARELGVSRFVTGSFAVLGNTIRIDARIVEARSGLQETAENVEGNQDEFFSLQKKLALDTLEHFRVRLTQAQEADLKKTTNSRVDKYRMLLEAEGLTQRAPPASPGTEEPHARLQMPRTESGATPFFSWGGIAYAQTPATAVEAAARAVLEEYRRAHEEGNLDHLAALYVSFPASQRQALDAYLKDARALRVELVDVKIQPRGPDLAVSYTRRDNFIDKETGEPVSLEVRATKFLVQDGGKWKFAEGP
jgi:TolB-like protein